MGKIIILQFVSFFICGFLNAQSITVDTYKDSWIVVLLREEGDDSWWEMWHEKKAAREYYHSPHKFDNLVPSRYSIVVYLPDESGGVNAASDGLSLHNIELDENQDLELYFKKSDFKIWNCLSCPWLYIYDGSDYVKTTEVLKDVVGCERETTTSFDLNQDHIIDDKIKIRLSEEKDEITFIDRVTLLIDGNPVPFLESESHPKQKLQHRDGDYLVLRKGENIDLEFEIPLTIRKTAKITLETEGYYEPDQEFLNEVFKTYQRESTD